jgi:hypothetical protein
MENKKYEYYTMKVETEEEYKEAQKLLLSGWSVLNFYQFTKMIQFVKIS